MKILIAPAETKQTGGIDKPLVLQPFQKTIADKYNDFVQNSSIEKLSKWFALKNLKDVQSYKTNIYNQPTLKAIQRYTGVAFEAISYDSLDKSSQNYIDQNILIFSNLFGVLNANQYIPNYKFKQGAVLPTCDTIKYYNTHLKTYLDTILEDQEILDLRAGFYEKFYKIPYKYTTLKFIKDNKVVSHWAKYYRGKVVQQIAKNNIQTIEQFMNLPLEDLSVVQINQQKNKTEIILAH